ncbi:MAG: SRPBCC family protein [Myxococcota bacterium]|nr:SRPBCC family protein [Myxococcota bacterium]
MSVITVDVQVEGLKRKQVFAWLGEPDNHQRILDGAFDEVSREGDREWQCTLKLFPKARTLRYRFLQMDDSHGGRRCLCETEGKRVGGKLHYSLRTPRAKKATLVTLHYDYDPGSILGQALNAAGLREGLEGAMEACLRNLQAAIYEDVKAGKLSE